MTVAEPIANPDDEARPLIWMMVLGACCANEVASLLWVFG